VRGAAASCRGALSRPLVNHWSPDNHAANDARRPTFVTAILEICDGKRRPLASMPSSLAAHA
jgi:hypothetical protein